MKKWIMSLMLLAAGVISLAGCGNVDNHPLLSSPVDNYPERMHRHRQIVDLSARQMVEDFDKLFLMERSSRLMYWHAQYGY